MKEKYIFFTLLIIAAGLLISTRVGKDTTGEISLEERQIEQRLRQDEEREVTLPEKINIEKIQDLVAFSHYEAMLQRSPFFKVPPKKDSTKETEPAVLPVVEDATPKFVYQGKIISGNRLVVIIKQTRTGEVLMVAKDQSIDGYKVLDITDTEVILSKKGAENIILKTIKSP